MDGSNKNWWEQFLKGSKQPSVTKGMTSSYTGLGGTRPTNTNFVAPGTAESQKQMGMPTSTPSMTTGGQTVGAAMTGFNPYQASADAARNAQVSGAFDNIVKIPDQVSSDLDEIILEQEGQEGRNWTSLFNAYQAAGLSAAQATKAAQQKAAEKTYEAQLARAQEQARQNRLASQQARQQISEQDFMQQRALTQAAAARGLSGSGVEQLGRVQARTATGQQINQLVQQEIAANTDLRNYLGQIDAQRETGISNAEATYQTQLFKLAGDDIEQLKYLDSVEYRDKVFAWQEENAKQEAARWKVDKEEQLLLYLANPDVDDYTKVALAKLAKQAGTIDETREKELLNGYLGAAAGDFILQKEFDWTLPLTLAAAGALTIGAKGAAIGATGGTFAAPGAGTLLGTIGGGALGALFGGAAGLAAGTLGQLGIDFGAENLGQTLNANFSFTNPATGSKWRGTGAEAIDKNNVNSLVYVYRNRAGYDAIQPIIKDRKIKFLVNGKEFNTYNEAEKDWNLSLG